MTEEEITEFENEVNLALENIESLKIELGVQLAVITRQLAKMVAAFNG